MRALRRCGRGIELPWNTPCWRRKCPGSAFPLPFDRSTAVAHELAVAVEILQQCGIEVRSRARIPSQPHRTLVPVVEGGELLGKKVFGGWSGGLDPSRWGNEQLPRDGH